MTGLLTTQFDALAQAVPYEMTGRVESVTGLTVQAIGLAVPVGATCEILAPHVAPVSAEVVGFNGHTCVLMPLAGVAGVAKGQHVRCVTAAQRMSVGPGLLGRVIDGLGRPMDDGAPIAAEEHYRVYRSAPHALERRPIEQPLSVGVRS